MWYCYILRNKLEQFKHNTYNGSTNNPVRRLRQHNEEIKGGAKATHGKGGAWEICAMLSGFPDHINALSCEWRMKCPAGRPGKRESKYQGVKGRISSLNEILLISLSSIKIVPVSGLIKPIICLSRTLFPMPLLPIIATHSPFLIFTSIFSKTSPLGKDLLMFSI